MNENKPQAVREIVKLTEYKLLINGLNKLVAIDPKNIKTVPYNDQIHIPEDFEEETEEVHDDGIDQTLLTPLDSQIFTQDDKQIEFRETDWKKIIVYMLTTYDPKVDLILKKTVYAKTRSSMDIEIVLAAKEGPEENDSHFVGTDYFRAFADLGVEKKQLKDKLKKAE